MRKGRKVKGISKNPVANNGAVSYMRHISLDSKYGFHSTIDRTVIAQYSFPMKTESVTHGFLKHKMVSDKLNSCPVIEGLCPESDIELNIQMVAMVSAPDEKLTGSHCLRPSLDWRCRLDEVRHDFGWLGCFRNVALSQHLQCGRSG